MTLTLIKRSLPAVLALLVATTPAFAGPAVSGIESDNVDRSIRVQDDFYLHVNGAWLKTAQIPVDRAAWGSFDQLRDSTLTQLHGIAEESARRNAASGSDAQKIGDLYASFMDEATLEQLGAKPLEPQFARIAALKDKSDIPALLAQFNREGINAPYAPSIHLDNRDATRYVIDISQSGLGMPDRDYYLANDAKLKAVRGKYREHIAKMFTLLGDKDAEKNADDIMQLETALAEVQWTIVQNRDPYKVYNKKSFAQLNELTPGYDWKPYFDAAGISGKVDYVIVSQPSYLQGFAKILQNTSLPVLQEYFQWLVLSGNAPLLSKEFEKEDFAFRGAVLVGLPQPLPRWWRAMQKEETALGYALGKLYVEKTLPPEYKARIDKITANLLRAFGQSIDTCDWMAPQTREAAKAKLAAFRLKIGYPPAWLDYSSLKIARNDLYGNMQRAAEFEFDHNVGKLGTPVDLDEWEMTPQTVNAYYNPEMNEAVFPAAILQKPFFNPLADDAVNYGALGAMIAGQINRAFDDQGARYDLKGNLRNWWTKEDYARFKARVLPLVKQYNAYEPLPGYHVNGELTLGENLADISGLEIAYKAYELSLGPRRAPVIDGLTGKQRFYFGYGQIWRAKVRDNAVIFRLKTDPHAPPQFRADGAIKNQPEFYEAFDVKPGDGMYLKPEDRVIIW